MLNPVYNPSQGRLRSIPRLILLIVFLVAGLAAIGLVSRGSGRAVSVVALPLILGLVLYLMAKAVDKRSFKDYGLEASPKFFLELILGLALGAILIGLVFLVGRGLGVYSLGRGAARGAYGFVQALVLCLCVAFQEEAFFRCYLLKNLAEGLALPFMKRPWPSVLAWVLSSLAFGLMHSRNPSASPLSTSMVCLAGLLIGLPFLLSGRAGLSLGLHAAWNFTEAYVFGFPVSGTSLGPSIGLVNYTGPSWLSGGPFGPEASVIVLVPYLVGGLILLAIYIPPRLAGKKPLLAAIDSYIPAMAGHALAGNGGKESALAQVPGSTGKPSDATAEGPNDATMDGD